METEYQLPLLLLRRPLSTSFATVVLHTIIYQVVNLGGRPSSSNVTPLSRSILIFLIAIAYPMDSLSPHDR